MVASGALFHEIKGQSVCVGKTTASEQVVKVALRAISTVRARHVM
jgi:hypothetical protein